MLLGSAIDVTRLKTWVQYTDGECCNKWRFRVPPTWALDARNSLGFQHQLVGGAERSRATQRLFFEAVVMSPGL
jgi:hypothetical protein